MSALSNGNLANGSLRNATQRTPGLTLVQSVNRSTSKANSPILYIAKAIIIGFVAICLTNLFITTLTSDGVYKVSALKKQQAHLNLNTQILGQQVSSLSSDQNLSNAAQALGMVANANPVFLDVNAQQVHGKPEAAIANPNNRVSGNLVANSVMTSKTTAKALKAAVAAQERKATATVLGAPVKVTSPASASRTALGSGAGYVGGAKSTTTQVGSANSGIPASPTH